MTLPVLFLRSPLGRVYKRDDHGRFGSGSGGGGEAIKTAGTALRPEFEGLTTTAEVSSAAAAAARKITGRDIEFDFGSSDHVIAAEHASGILHGLEAYPETGLRRVQHAAYDDGGKESWAMTSRDGSTISFAEDAQKYGADSYRKDLKQEQREHFIKVGTPMGVALHEFGHAVANSYGVNAALSQHARDYTEMAMKSSHHGAAVAQAISRYAATSDREMVAEAFSDHMWNGDKASGLSKDIAQMLPVVIRHPGHPGNVVTFLRSPLDRVYKRDSEGQFSSTDGGGDGEDEDLGSIVEPELLATASGGNRSVARFTDPDGDYGEPGGHVVSISEYGEKPNWRNSDGMNNGELTLPTGDAAAMAHGITEMASVARSAPTPSHDPDEGPVVLGTTITGDHRITAFHDTNGDFGGDENSRFIQVSESSAPDWQDSLRGATHGRLLDVDLADAAGLSSAILSAAGGAQAITYLSPAGRVYKRDERGRFGSGGTGGTVRKALADAKTKDELTAAAEAAAARVTGRPEGDIRFFARHSDLEVAKQHFEGVLQGLERFPHAPLSTVSDFDPDNPGAMHYDADVAQTIAYSGMGYEKGSINFNAQYSAHPDRYQKALDQSAEDAFTTSSVRTPHLVAPTMQGVALHEFGHVLTQQQHPLVGGGSGPPKVPAKKIAAELNPGGKTTADFIRDEISEYATTNQHELSAEAFADVVHNGSSASHVSRAIYNEIAALYPEDAQAVTWLRPLDRTYKRDERGRFGSGGGGVRHSLAEAQTAEQVAAVASQELGDRLGHPVSVNLTGLDVGLARQHMEGVLRGAERFSNGVGLTKIDTEDMTAYGEMKHGVGAGLTITFSTRYNESDYKGMLDRQHAEFGRSGAPGDYTHTGTHEYGHAVAHSHGAPTRDEHGGGVKLDGPERIMRDTADRMSLDAGGKESGRGFKYRPDEQVSAGDFTVNQIGYYAATNHGEAFAEAFADVVSRGAHAAPLAKEVMSQVDAEYGGGAHAITWLRPLDAGRVYKRDDRGRFGSGGGGGADESPGMRPELAGATSLRALETAAVAEAKRITGRDITFSAAGSDLATAKSHFEGVMQALERFPKANLNRVVNAQIADNAYAHATSDGSVVFNTKFSSAAGRQEYLKSLAEDSDGWNQGLRIYGINDLKMSSFHVRNAGTPEGVALHEMGHILDIATTNQRSRPLREHVLTLATAREQRRQTIPGAPIAGRGDMVLRSISAYANTNHKELAAEAFADVMINGKTASKLSHAIFNALNAEYEIQTGGQP